MNDVEITCKINGKFVSLSTISVEMFEKIKANEGKDKYEICCDKHPFYLNMVATVIDDPKRTDYRLVRVQLPEVNNAWTFAAFKWVKNFVLWSNGVAYPVHGGYAPDADALYICIPRKGK